MSLLRMSTRVGCLASNRDWRSRNLKKYLKFEGTRMDGTGLSRCELPGSYFADQLKMMTPHFSGVSTLNGTPGGDRWARVIGGQIGWLPEPLHRFDADCSGCTNLKMQTYGKHERSRPTENTPRNPHQPSDRDHLETAREKPRPTRAHTRPLP